MSAVKATELSQPGVLFDDGEIRSQSERTRYGALAAWGPDGKSISFLHAEMSVEPARRIGFGGLDLTDPQSSRAYMESDDIAAGASAVVMHSAQLFERVRAAAQWTRASREITTALLSGVYPHVRPLQVIVDRAYELTDAEQAIVLVPVAPELPIDEIGTLVVSAAVGMRAAEVIGQQVPVHGSTTGDVLRCGTPLITESFRHPIKAFTDAGERPAIVMPLRAEQAAIGVIVVARNKHQEPFDTSYLELVSDFVDHAVMALTLAAAREQAHEVALVADRERIAHDLHDHVIQRLFAAGMDLQGTIARSHSREVTDRLNRTVDDLQTTIEDIRTAIFHLQPQAGRHGDFRKRMQRAVADLTENCDIATIVQLFGPMIAVGAELAEHAEAVIVEAISNTVRHSGATSLTIVISVADELAIDIIDNGCGIPADNQRHSGLANLHRRAEQVDGNCRISSAPAGGTHVCWTAPLMEPLNPGRSYEESPGSR